MAAALTLTGTSDIFEETVTFPDSSSQRRYEALIGLADVQARLKKEAELLIDPGLLARWSQAHHGGRILAVTRGFEDRIPLFIFAGDVGTGKTVLAETFGDAVARDLGIEIFLFRMSLRARGTGSVGEMTQLISAAFDYVKQEIPVPGARSAPTSAAVLLIDEADALAQSRELAQMHHEDRAGVNALIRGIDGVAADRRPVLTVMCSNRLGALDPAIQRRAADIVEFRRPGRDQREQVLQEAFGDAGFSGSEISELTELTGPQAGRSYGYTYSDLRTRLIPAAVLEAFPDRALSFELVADTARRMAPTPPFGNGDSADD